MILHNAILAGMLTFAVLATLIRGITGDVGTDKRDMINCIVSGILAAMTVYSFYTY